jgi:hypothetical protein
MGYPIRGNNCERTKKEAREAYDKIGRVWSSVLNDYISFNSVGFRHLLWKGKARRSYPEQMKRLALIPFAITAISAPSRPVVQRDEKEYSRIERDGLVVTIKNPVRFWAFYTTAEGKNIRVIVRQVNNGHKHFFSIFEEDKQKRTHE